MFTTFHIHGRRKRRRSFVPWSLALREEHRLSAFEKRVLMGIFGLKRGDVTGEWRRIHNEETMWKT